MEPDELAKLLINEGSARLELAMRALEAAARSALDAKICAFGKAIATGAVAADDALVDEETFVVQALAQLEAPHIKLLQIMRRPRIPSPQGDPYRKSYRDWAPRDLGRQYPQAQPVMGVILADLTACGAGPNFQSARRRGRDKLRNYGVRQALIRSTSSCRGSNSRRMKPRRGRLGGAPTEDSER